MIIKNKKGFLLANETLKIIIAVICIGFLVYFLSMLYMNKTGVQKQEEAKQVLDRIEMIIDNLNAGGSENQGIGNPRSWNIYSFVSGEKPNSCVGQSCLCICKKAFDPGKQLNRQPKVCDSDGACLAIRGLQSADLDIKIMGDNSLVFLNIEKTSQGIFIKQVT
jgi:hypothetical protein